ncbi:porin family protein [Hymenobacter radiodurans]|uniref:porin family protein n=1 Tax=Hymenobacter radiodurans TaxID=2496028 RepID=UPI0010592040|nr:porin family protein [Hymenobacter radiodurans]
MKKVFLSFLLIAGAASFSHAQGVKLGLRAGANLSNYAGKGKENLENALDVELKQLVGPHGGITLNAPLSSDGFFSLQPELLYSQKGFRIEEDGAKQTVRNHYIDLPILARINADGLIFEAGPQLGYLVAAKSKYEGGGRTEEDSSLDGYNRFDIGYVAGVGYQFASGPSLTIRYNGGISSVGEDDDDDTKARNAVFQLSLGYVFGSN